MAPPNQKAHVRHPSDRLIRRDWAWEFLRRNPKFRDLHACVTSSVRKLGNQMTAVTISPDVCAEFRKWGCLYSDSPECEPTTARVFWDQSVCDEVVQMVAFEKDAKIDTPLFEISTVRCRVTMLVTPGRRQNILFQDDSQSLQLAVAGAPIDHAVHLLSATIVPAHVMRHHIRGLQCFQHLQSAGHLLSDYCAAEPRSSRYKIVLQALGGYLAGASHREIATTIYGARRVHADWDDPGRNLQDQVRRAVRRGRDLMEGGYLNLLK